MGVVEEKPEEIQTPLWIMLTTYFSYALLILVGHIRDFFGKLFFPSKYANLIEQGGYAPLTSDFESFFTRRLYYRVRDCWNRPVTGVPGREIVVLERESKDYNKTFKLTGKKIKALNFSSYNYLGFAQSEGPCADSVEETLKELGLGLSSPRVYAGTQKLHQEVEELVARFVGKPAAIITSMGFATNSTTIPALVGKGSLIISDALNHSSLVTGSKNAGAHIRVFKHNDVKDLEECLREAIVQGMPRTHRPWKKILVIVEGLYSMEGNICNLPAIVGLKEKYKFYLYVDEAHSIGAVGKTGRGVCEYWGISPSKVDIMMGTFTKSFGAAGGYIAGSKELIDHLRVTSHGSIYGESISPVVCQQISSSLKIILGEDGTDDGKRRLKSLYDNSVYLRRKLIEKGFVVYGQEGSPIIPVIIYHAPKLAFLSRELLKRGISIVIVGYPATEVVTGRIRLCVSASHSVDDLDCLLENLCELGDLVSVRF